MDTSNLFQVLSSVPHSAAFPFPFIGVTVLILIYIAILYLVIDLSENNIIAPLSSGAEDCISGLSIEELQQLPLFDSGANISATCTVCLDGVQKGERCRIFPGCRHVFHAHCIDLWLVRSLTCPTCRSPFRMKATFDIV